MPALAVTTYNVLCKNYAFRKRYPTIDPELLQWQNRREALVEKITSLQSDLFCLQEVSPGFFQRLEVALKPLGYEGLYLPPLKGPQSLAIFFRKERFTSVESDHLYFDVSGSGEGRWRPAQIALLTVDGDRLGVINTHLCFDDVGEMAHQEIKQLLDEVIDPSPVERWLICGDFNIVPNSSAMRELKERGFGYAAKGAEQVTCSIEGFAEKVDYICYTSATLNATHHPSREVTEVAALPCPGEPSDHLPVTATVALI